MRIHDTIIGIFLILLGTFILVQAIYFPDMPGQVIGPGTFPTVLAVGFMIGGLLVALQGWRARASMRWIVLESGWAERRRLVPVLIGLVGTLVLAANFDRIGFPLGGGLLLVALYFSLGYRSLKWAAISILFVSAVYYGMAKILLVPLPLGILQ